MSVVERSRLRSIFRPVARLVELHLPQFPSIDNRWREQIAQLFGC